MLSVMTTLDDVDSDVTEKNDFIVVDSAQQVRDRPVVWSLDLSIHEEFCIVK